MSNMEKINLVAFLLVILVVAGIDIEISAASSPSPKKGAAPEPLSVHILDSVTGGNAPNITTKLYKKIQGKFIHLYTERTDVNGRVLEMLPFDEFFPGEYRVTMNTKEYFENKNISSYIPLIQVTFDVTNPLLDYHIPILLSPFSYVTYRGS